MNMKTHSIKIGGNVLGIIVGKLVYEIPLILSIKY